MPMPSPPPPPPPPMCLSRLCDEVVLRISDFAVEERRVPVAHASLTREGVSVVGHRVHSLGGTCWRFRRLLPRAEALTDELPVGMCAIA
jgi:hypothetical protein